MLKKLAGYALLFCIFLVIASVALPVITNREEAIAELEGMFSGRDMRIAIAILDEYIRQGKAIGTACFLTIASMLKREGS